MNYLAVTSKRNFWYRKLCYTVLCGILLLAANALGQSDPFGQTDMFYIDSVEVITGNDISVHFNIRNDEPLNSLSLPIKYDPALLTLKSLSFIGSRAEYIANKIITPSQTDLINGHFLVGSFTIFEDAIPSGDGLIFTAIFSVNQSAPVGTVAVIDTLFYPPAGEMILVEATTSQIIKPAFVAGKVAVVSGNKAPTISTIPNQYIFEGDSLHLDISASDLNHDNLTLVCSNLPTGATFVDHQDGTATLNWQPAYIGPFSADGSPFNLSVLASDGSLTKEQSFSVNVVNKNRQPVIANLPAINGTAGDLVAFELTGIDPDFEPITWQVLNAPTGAQIDLNQSVNFSWDSKFDDTGAFTLTFIAADPQGYADTGSVDINLAFSSMYTLTFDTASAYPGEIVEIKLNLANQLPVKSFNILASYDPTVMTLTSIYNEGSRSESFESFTYSTNIGGIAGRVRFVGDADLAGSGTLASGDGAVAVMKFKLSANLSYAGYNVPVRFVFVDPEDNILTDTIGVAIPIAGVNYFDGGIQILDYGKINIGDINLNGIAFDIGDAIYFSNYFMNPFLYPFNPLQYANSDINHDNNGGTIADLVTLINIIAQGGNYSYKVEGISNARVLLNADRDDNNGFRFSYESETDLGAFLIVLDNENYSGEYSNLTDDMSVLVFTDETTTRILIYSLEGHYLSAGEKDLIELSGLAELNVNSIATATSAGQLVDAEYVAKFENYLPENFELYQNYPNPFNPETNISFDLPEAATVRLAIFNILGEKVNVLIDEKLPAGNHMVSWNGQTDDNRMAGSGVYFYRLETEKYQQTKKMMLLK